MMGDQVNSPFWWHKSPPKIRNDVKTARYFNRRKFGSQTSDNIDSEKQRWEESEKRREEERRSKREEKRRRKIKKRKSPKKEDPGARKGRKVAKHCVFPMIWGSGGSKSRRAKAAGAEPSGQMRDEKLHAVVARSTFASEKAKNTSRSDHFWKLRCRKGARRCGAKHISKWTCTKYTSFGPLLEVAMSKKGTEYWAFSTPHNNPIVVLYGHSSIGTYFCLPCMDLLLAWKLFSGDTNTLHLLAGFGLAPELLVDPWVVDRNHVPISVVLQANLSAWRPASHSWKMFRRSTLAVAMAQLQWQCAWSSASARQLLQTQTPTQLYYAVMGSSSFKTLASTLIYLPGLLAQALRSVSLVAFPLKALSPRGSLSDSLLFFSSFGQ